jgi:hypothetical protein
MEFLIPPIVALLIFKTNQSYAFDLNPTNGKPSLNGQSSTFRCMFVYLKKVISRLTGTPVDQIDNEVFQTE